MKTIIQCLFITSMLLLVATSRAVSAPFARVPVKTPNLVVVELGNTNGFFTSNLASADIFLSGISVVGTVAAAAFPPTTPVGTAPIVLWNFPDANTLQFKIYNLPQLLNYAIGVKICDTAGVCADNSQVLPRFPGAASATMGFAPGAITVPHNYMGAYIGGGPNGVYGDSIMQVTFPTATVITGFEGIGSGSPVFPNPNISPFTTAYVSVYSNFGGISSAIGDIANRVPHVLTPGPIYTPANGEFATHEMRGKGQGIFVPAGTYYLSVTLESPTPASLGLVWAWTESNVNLGTEWFHGFGSPIVNYTGSYGYPRGTSSLDLVGYAQ